MLHLEEVRIRHEKDLKEGGGCVRLPGRLDVKFPDANRLWCWQWVFPGVPKIQGSGIRPPLPAPPLRDRSSVSGEGCGGRRENPEAGHLPYLPTFFRYPSPGRWVRYPDNPGTDGPQRRQHHHDLHPCPEQGNRRLPPQPIASPSGLRSLSIPTIFKGNIPHHEKAHLGQTLIFNKDIPVSLC